MSLRKKPVDTPVPVMRELRERALSSSPAELGLGPDQVSPVWLAIMDFTSGPVAVTLVSINDGTTSLYFGNGGGIIGGGTSEEVAQATGRFLGTSWKHLESMRPATDHSLPAVGDVRFWARTPTDLVMAEVANQDVARPDHQLHDVFRAAHAVITQVRLNSPQPH